MPCHNPIASAARREGAGSVGETAPAHQITEAQVPSHRGDGNCPSDWRRCTAIMCPPGSREQADQEQRVTLWVTAAPSGGGLVH
jgi:hypothetical protein